MGFLVLLTSLLDLHQLGIASAGVRQPAFFHLLLSEACVEGLCMLLQPLDSGARRCVTLGGWQSSLGLGLCV